MNVQHIYHEIQEKLIQTINYVKNQKTFWKNVFWGTLEKNVLKNDFFKKELELIFNNQSTFIS